MPDPEIIDQPPADAPKRDPLRGLRRALIALGILAIIWVLFGQVVPRYLFEQQPQPAVDTSALQKHVAQLEARIQALESREPEQVQDSDVQEKISTLTAQMEALKSTPQTGASTPALESRLQEMQEQINQLQAHNRQHIAALAAFESLEAAVERGDPFDKPLAELLKLTEENRQAQGILKKMAPYVRSGTTIEELQRRFADTVPDALARDDDSALERNLRELISIRRVGEKQAGIDDESIIARAEAQLEGGEVEASVRELATLSPAAGKDFAKWINKARIWLYLNDQLTALRLSLLTAAPALPVPAAPAAPAAAEPAPESEAEEPKANAAPAYTPIPILPPEPVRMSPLPADRQ